MRRWIVSRSASSPATTFPNTVVASKPRFDNPHNRILHNHHNYGGRNEHQRCTIDNAWVVAGWSHDSFDVSVGSPRGGRDNNSAGGGHRNTRYVPSGLKRSGRPSHSEYADPIHPDECASCLVFLCRWSLFGGRCTHWRLNELCVWHRRRRDSNLRHFAFGNWLACRGQRNL
jgi:hypothetical protein